MVTVPLGIHRSHTPCPRISPWAPFPFSFHFPGGSVVKNLPAFQSLGGEDPLEGEKAIHSGILA